MLIPTRLALAALVTALLLSLAACKAPGPAIRDLQTRGLRERSIAKIVFVAASTDPGAPFRVTVIEPGVNHYLWTALQSAKPAEAKPVSHARTLEIYDSVQARIPAATFLVDPEQLTPADQPQTGAYLAPGLYDLMGTYLATEHDRQQRRNPAP